MKVRLTESDLKRVVFDGARRVLFEMKIDNAVSRTLNEFFEGYNGMNEEGDPSEDSSDEGSNKKRQYVIQYLQSPEVDIAQYAYRLWPEKSQSKKDQASVRSYFYKCLKREKDDNGNDYNFSNDDINKLYSMITSGPR